MFILYSCQHSWQKFLWGLKSFKKNLLNWYLGFGFCCNDEILLFYSGGVDCWFWIYFWLGFGWSFYSIFMAMKLGEVLGFGIGSALFGFGEMERMWVWEMKRIVVDPPVLVFFPSLIHTHFASLFFALIYHFQIFRKCTKVQWDAGETI